MPDNQQLRRIEQKIDLLLVAQQLEFHMEAQEMADLSALTQEVSQNNDAIQSAITLLQGLKTALDEAIAANDPAAIQALADQLDAQTQELANAVTANTPAAPAG